ncbi:MAG: hypothetical protein EVA89_13870, partial [Sandaracinaceae bacterium]
MTCLFAIACDGELPRQEGTIAGDCTDGADNDGDGAFDCDDSGCTRAPSCQGRDAGIDPGGDAQVARDADVGRDAQMGCSCVGLACGDDGCGGSCGECSGLEMCVMGACVEPGCGCDVTFSCDAGCEHCDPECVCEEPYASEVARLAASLECRSV